MLIYRLRHYDDFVFVWIRYRYIHQYNATLHGCESYEYMLPVYLVPRIS